MIRGFFIMVTFFTRIPIGGWVHYNDTAYKKGLFTFPFVGLVIGALMCWPFLFSNMPIELRALLIVTSYVFISGGIHLDGLADSADGLFSGRERVRMLEIMKDSQIGTFGVIALIMYFLFFFVSVKSVPWLWVLYMPFVGKAMGFIAASISGYAREDHGMGYVFIHEISGIQGFVMVVITLGAIFLGLGLQGVFAAGGALMAMLMVRNVALKRIGGQTGDTIGMTIEIAQMVFLVMGGIIWAY